MKTRQLILSTLVASAFTLSATATDWAEWRGPNADGISAESVKPSGDIAWTAQLGLGYGAVSVKDGKLYAAGNVDDEDVIYCLDPETGKEIWTYKYASDKGGSYFGPLGTPVTDGKTVWVFNRHGDMIALDAVTGKKLWQTTLMTESTKMPGWKTSSSVLIYNDLAIVAMGDYGAAVNKSTGEVVWASDGETSYSTPSIMTTKGKDYMLIMGAATVSVVNPSDGTLLAQVPYPQDCNCTGSSPIIIDAEKGHFLVTSGYKSGRCIRFAFDGKDLKELWNVKDLTSHFASPVYKDGVIYGSHGMSGARKALRALDAETGEVLWTSQLRFGAPIIAGDTLIYLDERGGLSFLNVDKTKEDLIETVKITDGKGKGRFWQMPVLANGYIYSRDSLGLLVAVKVK